MCGVAINEPTFGKPYSPFGPRPPGKSKPTVVESRPGAQRRAAGAPMAVKANRFEEGAVFRLQYACLFRVQTWHGREGLRREMLAYEKIRPALRTCGVVGP